MPFTFAHPAIVLPLRKLSQRFFSLTGLIIGSMVPDFEYFIRMKVRSEHSHTFAGLFYFDLQVGLIVYLLFVQFVREALIIHLPASFRQRFQFTFKDNNLLIILFSLFVGAVTHLFWDSFTHETGYVVQHINFLRDNIVMGDYAIPVFKILQHGSTLAGLLIIAYAIMRLPKKNNESFIYRRSYWMIVFIVFDLVILGKYLTHNFISFGDWMVTAISAVLLGVFISSIIYHARFSHR